MFYLLFPNMQKKSVNIYILVTKRQNNRCQIKIILLNFKTHINLILVKISDLKYKKEKCFYSSGESFKSV